MIKHQKMIRFAMLTIIFSLLVFTPVIHAQDATATPDTEAMTIETDENTESDEGMQQTEATPEADGGMDDDMQPRIFLATLEELTADSESYYGQEVTLEGIIADFINNHAFTLGEGALLDDDQVLVINTTDELLEPNISKGTQVRISGIIMPYSLEDFPEALPSVDIEPLLQLNERAYDGYEQYTILLLDEATNIEYIETIEAISALPTNYYNDEFFVNGNVSEMVTERSFVLTEGALLDNDRLLVFLHPDYDDPFDKVEEGTALIMHGTIVPFGDPQLENRFGFTLDNEVFADYTDYTVLVADNIEFANSEIEEE